MATPIQVVLNANNFIEIHLRPGGGGRKDFFEGRDTAFKAHRDRLATQVQRLAGSRAAFQRSSIEVASVLLSEKGLAKSNRPAGLLNPTRVPGVGTGGPAELLIQVTRPALSDLANRIASAEDHPRTKEKLDRDTGELVESPAPSGVRCDVGVIDSVRLWSSDQRVPFGLDTAMEWLASEQVTLSLTVHLFEFADMSQASTAELAHVEEAITLLGGECSTSRIEEDGQGQHYLFVVLPRTRTGVQRERLAEIMAILADSFLVREVRLPARVRREQSPAATERDALPAVTKRAPRPPRRVPDASYPTVAIIDGGVGPAMRPWVMATDMHITRNHADPEHGGKIAGLLVAGRLLNGADIAPEPDGCNLIDVCALPADLPSDLFDDYYNTMEDFLDVVENAVARAARESGVRVFNFSINFDAAPGTDLTYAYEARRLDAIAIKHDVVFVFSAGNLPNNGYRLEWPANEIQALGALNLGPVAPLALPAYSVANVAVSAINPPAVAGIVAHVPAAYSRIGPSAFGGVKPDVTHYGGRATMPSGLRSFNHNGHVEWVSGTSFAAPLVAKALARYVQEIQGKVSREMLIALLLHHSSVPDVLASEALAPLARNLVGFGLPHPVAPSLEGSPHQATIVFEESIPQGSRLMFPFRWPASLVGDDGKCRGRARLTLVARPQIDTDEGREAVRTQLDAHVLQLGRNAKPKGGKFETPKLPEGLRGRAKQYERELIRHNLK